MLVIDTTPGTYMLLFQLPIRTDLEIGRRGNMHFEPGLYCYVGSALGPGGLVARLRHHAFSNVRKHWHVDYFKTRAQLVGALIHGHNRKLECSWAAWLSESAGKCVPGFGASDCGCSGHLFVLDVGFRLRPFIEQARRNLKALFVPKQQLIRLAA